MIFYATPNSVSGRGADDLGIETTGPPSGWSWPMRQPKRIQGRQGLQLDEQSLQIWWRPSPTQKRNSSRLKLRTDLCNPRHVPTRATRRNEREWHHHVPSRSSHRPNVMHGPAERAPLPPKVEPRRAAAGTLPLAAARSSGISGR